MLILELAGHCGNLFFFSLSFSCCHDRSSSTKLKPKRDRFWRRHKRREEDKTSSESHQSEQQGTPMAFRDWTWAKFNTSWTRPTATAQSASWSCRYLFKEDELTFVWTDEPDLSSNRRNSEQLLCCFWLGKILNERISSRKIHQTLNYLLFF